MNKTGREEDEARSQGWRRVMIVCACEDERHLEWITKKNIQNVLQRGIKWSVVYIPMKSFVTRSQKNTKNLFFSVNPATATETWSLLKLLSSQTRTSLPRSARPTSLPPRVSYTLTMHDMTLKQNNEALADSVRTSLGPKGMDKMVLTHAPLAKTPLPQRETNALSRIVCCVENRSFLEPETLSFPMTVQLF